MLWLARIILVCIVALPAKAEVALPDIDFVGEGTWCATSMPCGKLVVYYTPTRWRFDVGEGENRTTYIYDFEKKTKTQIMHWARLYRVEDYDPKLKVRIGFGFLPTTAIAERVGEDVVDGRMTSKYRVTDREFDREGFVWLTAEHIVVRMETNSVREKSSMIKFAATKITIGPFDPKTFANAIPDSFKRFQP